MESEPTRVCELLVGLPDVFVLGVDDETDGELRVHVECRSARAFCESCGIEARLKERPVISLIDLPCFGRRTRLVWHKRRFSCPDELCPRLTWTEEDLRIGAPRMTMTDRAGRWVTEQVGRSARSVNEVARELGCDWHTVNDTVVSYGTALVDDDPSRYGTVTALGLDEVVQNATMGHRGRKTDPLYRCRRLLTKAEERLDDHGRDKLLGLLRAGDPLGEVTTAWHAKEAVREIYSHTNAALALEWVEHLGADMADSDNPVEVRSLGRTLLRWKHQIVAWHAAQVSNGPTEAANNLIKRVKRAAFGFTSFRNYRIRSLLYAGKPNWKLLATITPR